LIEDQKIVQTYFAGSAGLGELADQVKVTANGKHVETALGKFLSRLSLGLGALHLLRNAARGVAHFAYEFGHIY
jgi:hypothetical protein